MYCVKILSTGEVLFKGNKDECWTYVNDNQPLIEKTLYVTKADVNY